jgi:hypothetical protein
MPYTITAISIEGTVSFLSRTTAEALKTAIELVGLGLEEISITDGHGQQYTPADFERFYIDA